jgi:recombination protein RecR
MHDCSECHTISDGTLCGICKNQNRDKSLVCVVASPQEVESIERSGTFQGVYHVLHGLLNQMEGIGPDDLTIAHLEKRLIAGGIKELIIAVSPTVEGEITAQHLTQKFSPHITVSRIARGLPIGSLLEYMDDATIAEALRDRTRTK